jgi:hypothetical protein
MISQDGPNAFRRTQRSQSFGAGIDISPVGSGVVTGEDDHIRFGRICQIDGSPDFIDTHYAAVMDIGELRNAKAFKPLREVAKINVSFANFITVGFNESSVCCGRGNGYQR